MELMDVYFFIGRPRDDAPVYHVIVRHETYLRMEKDTDIYITNVRQLDGTFENDELPPVDPVWFMEQPHCGSCLNVIRNISMRPPYCYHCGRRILYEDS